MASYVFWQDESSGKKLMCINIATLAGTLLGQVAFGYLADRYGRKKMYGVELMLLITSTLGVVMSSNGVNASMDAFSWLIWWRIVVGIGVGADYPLSAVITSEYVLQTLFCVNWSLGQNHGLTVFSDSPPRNIARA